MTGRLLILVVLVVLGAWAASASRAGSGAQRLARSLTPAQAIANHQAYLDAEAARLARIELDRRYRDGEMDPAERIEYEIMIAEEERIERERVERERAAAVARAVAIRNTRRTGGGPSSGK